MPQAGLISQYQFLSFDGGAYSNQGRNLKTWWNFEDFLGGWNFFPGMWFVGLAGAGTSVTDIAGTALRPGLAFFSTGTTATGRATIYAYSNNTQGVLFGSGEYTFETDVYIPTLSTVGDEYAIQLGFGDTSGPDAIDGAYFKYDRLAAGVNWRLKTSSNSARTDTDSTIAVAAGAWTRLKIIVNASATLVSFYINGVLAGTVSTNIPSGAGRETGLLCQILKSAGLNPLTFYMDWVWVHINLNTSR